MNIENFPTSESAKNMMSYITGNGFYDDSWVGKWIFQVMGMEMDDARVLVEDLPNQAFPETATWAIGYHEEKFGLPVREHLALEERRKVVLAKRNKSTPSSPWKMEQIIKDLTGYEVHVTDINEPGNLLPHPNVFEILLKGEMMLDISSVKRRMDKMKQSHTTYKIYVYCETGINIDASPRGFRSVFDICGTLPILSTALNMDAPEIVIQEKLEAYRAKYIKVNEHEAGQIPNISTRTEIQNSIITILENTYAAKSPYVQLGNEKAGEEPMQSTKLSLNELTIRIDEDADGYKSVSILAGVDPNLSCGLDTSGEKMSMEPSVEEYIAHFKMCGEEL